MYPIFIPSYHRHDIHGTARILDDRGIEDYRLIVEKEDLPAYRAEYGAARVIELDPKYKEEYETCDDLGLSMGVGPGAVRNMAWDVAVEERSGWFWTIDDNLVGLYRYGAAGYTKVRDGRRCSRSWRRSSRSSPTWRWADRTSSGLSPTATRPSAGTRLTPGSTPSR